MAYLFFSLQYKKILPSIDDLDRLLLIDEATYDRLFWLVISIFVVLPTQHIDAHESGLVMREAHSLIISFYNDCIIV